MRSSASPTPWPPPPSSCRASPRRTRPRCSSRSRSRAGDPPGDNNRHHRAHRGPEGADGIRYTHRLRFAATELAVAQHLTDIVVGAVGEPELAALVLGKAAEASERGVELRVDDDLEVPAGMADPRDLVMIVGNLLDNAVDAAAEAPAPRWVRLEAGVLTVDGVEELELAVADSGPGLGPDAAAHAFDRGWTTKKTDRPMGRGVGLALVAQAVHRLGGTIRSRTRSERCSPCGCPGAAPHPHRTGRASPIRTIRPGSPSTSQPGNDPVLRRSARRLSHRLRPSQSGMKVVDGEARRRLYPFVAR